MATNITPDPGGPYPGVPGVPRGGVPRGTVPRGSYPGVLGGSHRVPPRFRAQPLISEVSALLNSDKQDAYVNINTSSQVLTHMVANILGLHLARKPFRALVPKHQFPSRNLIYLFSESVSGGVVYVAFAR